MKEFSLPAAAGTVTSEAFDLFEEKTPNDIHNIHAQFEVSLLNVTLPAGSITISVESSDVANFATDKQTFMLGTLTTGTHSNQKWTVKNSEKPKRYWRAVITTTGATGNLSTTKAVLSIVFLQQELPHGLLR